MDNFKREYLDQKEPLHFKKLRIEDLSGDVESGEFDTKVIVDYTLAGKPGTSMQSATARSMRSREDCRLPSA